MLIRTISVIAMCLIASYADAQFAIFQVAAPSSSGGFLIEAPSDFLLDNSSGKLIAG